MIACTPIIETANIMHRHSLKTHSMVFIVHDDKPNGRSFTYGVENQTQAISIELWRVGILQH